MPCVLCDFVLYRAVSRYGRREPAYAATEIMSSRSSFSVAVRITVLADPARVPTRNATNWRSMYAGDRPASGGATAVPLRDMPWQVTRRVGAPSDGVDAMRLPRAALPGGTHRGK